jgi:hypothetical protein
VQSATRHLKLSLTSPKAYRISLRKINVYGEAALVCGLFNFKPSLRCRFTAPISEVTASLDHLIGATEQRERERDAERLGGLQIDVQLNFRRLLDR